MTPGQELLEDQLQRFEEELRGLNSYVKELKSKADEHDTSPEHFTDDLTEAEHNIQYYEAEIARLKGELGGASGGGRPPQSGANPPRAGADSILPRTAKQGVGSFVFSAIGFVAGALLGSRFKSRKDD